MLLLPTIFATIIHNPLSDRKVWCHSVGRHLLGYHGCDSFSTAYMTKNRPPPHTVHLLKSKLNSSRKHVKGTRVDFEAIIPLNKSATAKCLNHQQYLNLSHNQTNRLHHWTHHRKKIMVITGITKMCCHISTNVHSFHFRNYFRNWFIYLTDTKTTFLYLWPWCTDVWPLCPSKRNYPAEPSGLFLKNYKILSLLIATDNVLIHYSKGCSEILFLNQNNFTSSQGPRLRPERSSLCSVCPWLCSHTPLQYWHKIC